MNARQTTCDPRQTTCNPDRIEQFLNDGLSDIEQTDFELHLEQCTDCRRKLEHSAARDDVWSAVRDSLLAEDLFHDSAQDHVPDPESESPASYYQVTARALLSPSDDERSLGRLGTYEVVGVVGSGGMGIVFKAHDPALDRYVAIKVMAPHLAGCGAARQRFLREARAAAAVVHENVIDIHGVGEANGLPYLVMSYVRGESLQRRLDGVGAFGITEILRIGTQAAAGLAAAHAQGLIHRDVSPGNILLDDGVERVKLTDFGLARAADDANLTRSGVIAGTPHYMSPEQARGGQLDQRSDLFSLGSVLYAMCAGRPPFRADTSYGVLRRITDDDPRTLREINPDIPDWFCNIVARLMEKDPALRFQTAREVADLLERCLAHVQQPTLVQLPDLCTSPERRPTTHASWGFQSPGWNVRRIVGTALIFAFTFFAGVMIVLELNKGTLTIESEVDDVAIRVMQEDKEVETLTVTRSGTSVRIAAGQYVVRIEGAGNGLQVVDGKVSLKRGDREVVRIIRKLEDPPASAGDQQPPSEWPRIEANPSLPPAPAAESSMTPALKFIPLGARGHQTSVEYSRDGRRLAVANGVFSRLPHMPDDWRPAIKIYDLADDDKIVSFDLRSAADANTVSITAHQFSPDGKLLAVGTNIGEVKLFNAESGELIRELKDVEATEQERVPTGLHMVPRAIGSVSGLAFSPDGASLAVCGARSIEFTEGRQGDIGDPMMDGGRLKVFNVTTGELQHDLVGHTRVEAVAYSPDRSLLLSVGQWQDDGRIQGGLIAWNPDTGKKIFDQATAHVGGGRSIAISRDSTSVAFSTTVRTPGRPASKAIVSCIDVRRGGILKWQQTVPSSVAALTFTPDNACVAALSRDGTIRFFDTDSSRIKLELHCSFPGPTWRDMAISPSGDQLAIGSVQDEQCFVEISQLDRSRYSGEEQTPTLAEPSTQMLGAEGTVMRFSETNDVVLSAGHLQFTLDLDSGETMDNPAQAGRPEEERMDVYADQVQPYNHPAGLIGVNLRGQKVTPNEWNAALADVQKLLKSDSLSSLEEMEFDPDEPATYAFRTQSGTVGILQIMELTDDPKGIRIRYKTIQQVPATPPMR